MLLARFRSRGQDGPTWCTLFDHVGRAFILGFVRRNMMCSSQCPLLCETSMGLCSDPTLTYLNDLGYSVIRLPRAGIEPLDVLGRQGGRVERLGRLEQIWRSERALPVLRPPYDAGEINGQESSNIKISIGLKILENILGGLAGIAIPGIRAAFPNTQSIRFGFTGVQIIAVDPLAVGRFLASGDLDMHNPFVRYFDEHDATAYVLTDVLTADSVVVTAEGNTDAAVSLDIAALQQVVGAKLSVDLVASSSKCITIKGGRVAFGFKAFGIGYGDGQWVVHGAARPDGRMALSTDSDSAAPHPVVLNPLAFVSLDEPSSA
jgi:hypothetical protein